MGSKKVIYFLHFFFPFKNSFQLTSMILALSKILCDYLSVLHMTVFSSQDHRLEHILVYLRRIMCNVKKGYFSYSVCVTFEHYASSEKKNEYI